MYSIINKEAASLYRVSSMGQVKSEEIPIPAQRSAVHKFCKENNVRLIKEYHETGVSAFKNSAFDRDVIHQVLSDAKDGLFKFLIVFKNNRLSRLESEYPMILKEFKKHGVIVWEVNRNKRLTPMNHEEALVAYLDGWMAEGESRSISSAVKAGKVAKAEIGGSNGSVPPFGFAILEWELVTQSNKTKAKAVRGIDPYESSIINIIADLIEDGKGGKYIAQHLNSHELYTRNGRLWTSQTVRRTIKNPAVAGISLMKIDSDKPVRTHDYKHLYDPAYYVHKDSNGNYITDPGQTIIPIDRWFRIMEIIDKRRHKHGYRNPNSKKTYLLSGFLRCGYCGRAMTAVTHEEKYTKKDGTISIYDKSGYRCGSKALGIKCEGPAHVNYKKVDTAVMDEIECFVDNFDSEMLYSNEDNVKGELYSLRQELKRLEEEYKKVDQTKNRWLNELNEWFNREGNYIQNKENIVKMINDNEKHLGNIQLLMSEIQKKIDAKQTEKSSLLILRTVLPQWFNEFTSKPVEIQNKMLTQIIDQVVFYKNKIEIFYTVDTGLINDNQNTETINIYRVISQ